MSETQLFSPSNEVLQENLAIIQSPTLIACDYLDEARILRNIGEREAARPLEDLAKKLLRSTF